MDICDEYRVCREGDIASPLCIWRQLGTCRREEGLRSCGLYTVPHGDPRAHWGRVRCPATVDTVENGTLVVQKQLVP